MQNISLLNAAAAAAQVPGDDIPTWFVVCMGMGTVFVGLITIIILCKIIGAFCSIGNKKPEKATERAIPAATASNENRKEIIAAVAAVCAEDMGTEVSALRILSFKKL